MKIALIVICLIALASIVLEIASKISARKGKARWDRMTPDELRKEQEAAYRQQAYNSGI